MSVQGSCTAPPDPLFTAPPDALVAPPAGPLPPTCAAPPLLPAPPVLTLDPPTLVSDPPFPVPPIPTDAPPVAVTDPPTPSRPGARPPEQEPMSAGERKRKETLPAAKRLVFKAPYSNVAECMRQTDSSRIWLCRSRDLRWACSIPRQSSKVFGARGTFFLLWDTLPVSIRYWCRSQENHRCVGISRRIADMWSRSERWCGPSE